MELLIRGLFFLGGITVTVLTFLVWAWYLGLKERVRVAEEARQEMEEAIKTVEAQQKAAADQLQKSIDEFVKRRQAANQPKTPPPQMPADPGIAASVKDRLRKAVELTAKQNKIDPKVSPEFQMQHNELELEKLNVLKTIITDGFDPVITIRFNTGDREMLLSTYIQSISKGLA